MTTTTETPATCPPSDVKDMIVRWDELQPGDLFVYEEGWAIATEVTTYEDDWQGTKWMRTDILFRCGDCCGQDGEHVHSTDRHADRLVAVRRYQEG